MRKIIKNILLKLAPEVAGAWFDKRRNQYIQAFEKRIGLTELSQRYVEQCGLEVQNGLFAGMKYLPEATGSVFVPKLLGSYEAEIAEELKKLLTREYEVLVDIGSAEGYYAVGLAFIQKNLKVYAYDSDTRAQKLCQEMALLNGVEDRVTVLGKTTSESLNRVCGNRTLLICDVDGAEHLILDPEKVQKLKMTDILVETHDFVDSSITPTLIKRFEMSHDLLFIATCDKTPKDYPVLGFLTDEEQRKILGEYRPAPQTWGVFRARQR
ncbi:hypothetical protein [Armatimonas sp.]|uniref:hypothetical protein n=1 Tax=Armatimonas sp. TaxID=1872638 RepID=UPI003752F4DA